MVATIKPGYKQTEIGIIPEDWDVKSLGEISNIISGGTPRTNVKEYWDGEILWCTPTDITKTRGKYIIDTERKINKSGLDASSATLLPAGSLLLCSRATIGEVRIAQSTICTNQGFKSLVCKASVHNEYVYYKLLTIKNKLIEKSIGTTFLEISKRDTSQIKIAIPSRFQEQSTIAEVLSNTDELIEKLDKFIEKKKNIKQGVTQQLLTGRQHLPGFHAEWEPRELRSIVLDFIVPMRDKPKKFGGQIPWCRIEDFDGKYLTESKSGQRVDNNTVKEMNLKVYPKGTLLVSCSADLGRCAIVGQPLVSNQTFIGLVVDESVASNEFLYYYMMFKADELNNLSSGTTISYLSREQFESFNVLIPSTKSEQIAIAQVLSDMGTEIEDLEKKREKYIVIKKGMMQQLLTGRIRLR